MIAIAKGLLAYVEIYLLARDVSDNYAQLLRARIARFCRWHGAVEIDQLDRDLVNRFLAYLATTDASPCTIDNYRKALLAVWRFAYDQRENNNPPMGVRRIKRPRDVIEAYTHDEIRKLLSHSATLTDYFPNGVRKSDFWQAAITSAYDTALRRGDLLSVKRSQIATDGSAQIKQSKTGYFVLVRFSEQALEWIIRMAGDGDDRALRWPFHQNALPRQFRAIANGAGVHRGQFKWLRRSGASYAERISPGHGSRVLGHRTPHVFHAHYEDWSITNTVPVSPPPLGAASGGVASASPADAPRAASLPVPTR